MNKNSGNYLKKFFEKMTVIYEALKALYEGVGGSSNGDRKLGEKESCQIKILKMCPTLEKRKQIVSLRSKYLIQSMHVPQKLGL